MIEGRAIAAPALTNGKQVKRQTTEKLLLLLAVTDTRYDQDGSVFE